MIPGTLLYASPGVLTQEGDFNDHTPVLSADRPTPNSVSVTMMSGEHQSYDIDPGTLQSSDAGIVKFTDTDGQNYQIRPIEDSDGEWLSGLHTTVPASALRSLVADSDPKGINTDMSVYLKDKRETMVAFQIPDDPYLFGLLYINKFGAYIRLDQSWLGVSSDDDTFDETYPYMVNPDTVDDFIAAWDEGPMTVESAEQNHWVTAPEDEGSDDTDEKATDDE